MKVTYTQTIRSLANGYEVRVSATGTFWGIFKDGQKVTEMMNCQGSNARLLVKAHLAKVGIEF